MIETIKHEAENKERLCALVWRKNPYGQWEFWHSNGHWHNAGITNGPNDNYGDVTVSYEDTWCEPVDGVLL